MLTFVNHISEFNGYHRKSMAEISHSSLEGDSHLYQSASALSNLAKMSVGYTIAKQLHVRVDCI